MEKSELVEKVRELVKEDAFWKAMELVIAELRPLARLALQKKAESLTDPEYLKDCVKFTDSPEAWACLRSARSAALDKGSVGRLSSGKAFDLRYQELLDFGISFVNLPGGVQ